jgi:hypothetical protein
MSEVDDDADVPLPYASTSGALYAPHEIEKVGRSRWPDALMTFSARLFTGGDTTVVCWAKELTVSWRPNSTRRTAPVETFALRRRAVLFSVVAGSRDSKPATPRT